MNEYIINYLCINLILYKLNFSFQYSCRKLCFLKLQQHNIFLALVSFASSASFCNKNFDTLKSGDANAYITFRSSVTRSGKSGSGHSKPIIIGSSTTVVFATTVEPVGMFRHVREIWFLRMHPCRPEKKERERERTRHVRNARHTWLKVETISPFLPSPLTSILSAHTRATLGLRKDFFQIVTTTGGAYTFFHKRMLRTILGNIWAAGSSGERSCFCLMPFSLISRSSLMLGPRVNSRAVGKSVVGENM